MKSLMKFGLTLICVLIAVNIGMVYADDQMVAQMNANDTGLAHYEAEKDGNPKPRNV